QVPPENYVAAFLDLLANPRHIWDTAFRTHIPPMCRHLLFALFFSSEHGVEIDDLKMAFNALHPLLSAKYGTPYGAKDFDEALRILEGGFVAIAGESVRFINPSVRDYLTDYLDDASLLADFARASTKARWAWAVWRQVTSTKQITRQDQKGVVVGFVEVAKAFL